MGFMGISHWVESDNAADFRHELKEAITSAFLKELKNEANCYNTPGWLNALLILKSYPHIVHFLSDEVVDKIYARLKKDDSYLNLKGGAALLRKFADLRKIKEK